MNAANNCCVNPCPRPAVEIPATNVVRYFDLNSKTEIRTFMNLFWPLHIAKFKFSA